MVKEERKKVNYDKYIREGLEMKRLTLRKSLEWLDKLPEDYTFSTEELVYKKLGKLEDIADLCEKITKLPIYKKCCNNTIYEADYRGLNTAYNFLTDYIEVYGSDCEDSLSVEKYEIDWAFSREELI